MNLTYNIDIMAIWGCMDWGSFRGDILGFIYAHVLAKAMYVSAKYNIIIFKSVMWIGIQLELNWMPGVAQLCNIPSNIYTLRFDVV